MAWHAGPPVFGGPHRQNWLRNAQENALWVARLDGRLGPPPAAPFVLMGDANLDPEGGDGDHAVMRALLDHPALQDPRPTGSTPSAPLATANWPDGPGALRVDYVLPSRGLRVLRATLAWPTPHATHAMVVTDIAWPPD
jgi:endonuclease/exonuclease/phosphatase family metal-dependent hydrolase